MFHNERYYVRFKRYSNYFVKTCIWVKSSPITTKQSYFHIRVKYMRWQKKYKLLAVAKQLRRFPNWNMSNREYRNRLDRATQIGCSVRWEGEEATGGSLGHPALRPIHPTCIATHTPNMHCAHTPRCVHPTQNKYFHRLLFITAVADGNAVEFSWNISCRPSREEAHFDDLLWTICWHH